MKYRATIIFMAVVLVFVPAACTSQKSARDYSLQKVCDTEPRLQITKITVTDKDTRINFKYAYKPRAGFLKPAGQEGLAVAPPGQAGAISIIAADSGKKYKLLKAERIPVLPDYIALHEGSIVEFVLVFERIDDAVRKFNIIEGPAGMEIPWQFLNIQLP